MKNLKPAAAIAAVIAAIGKALNCSTMAVTRLLMFTGMDYGKAAARAPLVCGLALCIIGILCICAWMNIEDARDRRRQQYIERNHARTDEPEYRQNRRGA